MIVIADTSPLNYLVLIGQERVLPQLFGRILIPQAVFDELHAPETPKEVLRWIDTHPEWLEVRRKMAPSVGTSAELDPGEQEAIELAEELKADLVVIDDLAGRRYAIKRGLTVIGTLGVLFRAGQQNLVDLPQALNRLSQTTFRLSPDLLRAILDRDNPA
jgi:predicted nucleic acid-binding protein